MKSWTKSITINAPIDIVWNLFNGSTEQMQKIMPQVVANEPVKVTDEGVGTVYRQTYQEGKRTQTYDVETIEFTDKAEEKKLKVGFQIAGMFDITAKYELAEIDENTTHFTYTATNNPLKWYVKPFLLFASDKVVVNFVDRVKKVAETNQRNE
ncbi:SRPBCC family protein [Mangrovibacillus cuniculi]|uniref:SRPBCC family protein n=1 Tax=Mangrovibacillus cuniculi TaxID=2593652 RepID=A0A7S8HGL5_9BACI|nr:SRPBCC family protein [Mangrovibacillus cuniculi]QPC48124.1 SRPBCC family protein [Mangrovibacillus cuniculi]